MLQFLWSHAPHFTVCDIPTCVEHDCERQATVVVSQRATQIGAAETCQYNRKPDWIATQELCHGSLFVNGYSDNLPSVSLVFFEEAIQ